MTSNYYETLRALAQPIRAADLPHTLDPMRRLLDALGNPQAQFRSVVVAGSTGKGTTCLRIAHLLAGFTSQTTNYRANTRRGDLLGRPSPDPKYSQPKTSPTHLKIGLYTSPHLHSFRERIVIVENYGEVVTPRRITQPEFVDVAEQVFAVQRALNHAYSTFETTTALTLIWFAQQQVDVAVLEIGIGGRFDAVNAVANQLAVFTPIEMEHVAMLGGSLESVAWHKAGIIQPNGSAVSVPQSPEVQAVLEREARDQSTALHFTADPLTLIPQLLSASFPLVTQNLFRRYSSLITSLLSTRNLFRQHSVLGTLALPGRLERLTHSNHPVIIDGGHTPAAARHLLNTLHNPQSVRFIVGMLRDKNVAAYLSTFDLPHIHFVYTHAPSDRALTPDELFARYAPTQASVALVPSLDEAFAQIESAPEELIVVAGSFRMAAAAREAFGLLSADEREEARLTRAIFTGEAYQRKIN